MNNFVDCEKLNLKQTILTHRGPWHCQCCLYQCPGRGNLQCSWLPSSVRTSLPPVLMHAGMQLAMQQKMLAKRLNCLPFTIGHMHFHCLILFLSLYVCICMNIWIVYTTMGYITHYESLLSSANKRTYMFPSHESSSGIELMHEFCVTLNKGCGLWLSSWTQPESQCQVAGQGRGRELRKACRVWS